MGAFLNSVVLTPLPDGRNWRLDKALLFQPAFGSIIRVPMGFVTDLASTPQIVWVLFPPHGRYTPAAIVHDMMYRHHLGTRAQADAYFLEGMAACGVGRCARWTIYLAVRAFGWVPWRDDARRLRAAPGGAPPETK
jgi:hypothetical protein